MLVGVMITNGGPHTPEKWAQMTAGQIIQVASTANPAIATEGRKLELKILDILEFVHRDVQEYERDCLTNKGHDRLDEPLDPTVFVIDAAGSILVAGRNSQFREHFDKSETEVAIMNVLGQHFANSMHIERQWYCDKFLDNPRCREYKEKYQPSQ